MGDDLERLKDIVNKQQASNFNAEIIDDVRSLKNDIEVLKQQRSSAALPTGLQDEINKLGRSVRKNTVVVHNAPYVGTPEEDASAILSLISPTAFFGEFRAYRRGRKQIESTVIPILGILLTSEVSALGVLDAFASYKKSWADSHGGGRPPFKIEPDLPRALVVEQARDNKIVEFWRKANFGNICRHGKRIVYFVNGKYVGVIPRPTGNEPWPDPILPGDSSAVTPVRGAAHLFRGSSDLVDNRGRGRGRGRRGSKIANAIRANLGSPASSPPVLRGEAQLIAAVRENVIQSLLPDDTVNAGSQRPLSCLFSPSPPNTSQETRTIIRSDGPLGGHFSGRVSDGPLAKQTPDIMDILDSSV